ncbi:hypothetical protein ACLBKT_07520 [Erythrobacter sp. W302b]|uniref:hypothetical protein n=1 Tax=Erythrobacter sp. W302b TaxID=3389874 RepID=UPI00396B053F
MQLELHRCGGGDVDVASLEHAADHVRLVSIASTQAVDHRLIVSERLEEPERELGRAEGLLSEVRDGISDLNRVHSKCAWRRNMARRCGFGAVTQTGL